MGTAWRPALCVLSSVYHSYDRVVDGFQYSGPQAGTCPDVGSARGMTVRSNCASVLSVSHAQSHPRVGVTVVFSCFIHGRNRQGA
jgi:hypothetical protein